MTYRFSTSQSKFEALELEGQTSDEVDRSPSGIEGAPRTRQPTPCIMTTSVLKKSPCRPCRKYLKGRFRSPLPCFLDFIRISLKRQEELRCVRRLLWALAEVNGLESRVLCNSLLWRIPCCVYSVNQSLNGKSATGEIHHWDNKAVNCLALRRTTKTTKVQIANTEKIKKKNFFFECALIYVFFSVPCEDCLHPIFIAFSLSSEWILHYRCLKSDTRKVLYCFHTLFGNHENVSLEGTGIIFDN